MKPECIAYSIFPINNIPVISGVDLANIYEMEPQEITGIAEKNIDFFSSQSCWPTGKDKNGKETYAFTQFGVMALAILLNKEHVTRYCKKISKKFNELRERGHEVSVNNWFREPLWKKLNT